MPLPPLAARRPLCAAALTLALGAGCASLPPDPAVPPPVGPGEVEVAEGAPDRDVHVALSGGGWRAHTAHAGWTMTLLQNSGGRRTLDEMFARVGTVSSNSGGSWYLGMLAFSDPFAAALQADGASDTYATTGYLGQQAALFRTEPPDTPLVCDVLPDDAAARFYCDLTGYTGSADPAWFDIVTDVVYAPYGMAETLAAVPLSGAVQPWADGTSLLMAATALTQEAVLTRDDIGLTKYYSAAGAPSAYRNEVVPVTFSRVVGAFPEPPLLAAGPPAQVTYRELFARDRAGHWGAEPSARDVPVLAAISASSAAAGALASHRSRLDVVGFSFDDPWLAAYELSGLAVPFRFHPEFAHAAPPNVSIEELADAGFARFADGGYVDNSAVAQLVAFLQQSGRGDGFEIVAFDTVEDVHQPPTGAVVGGDLAALFGVNPDGPGVRCAADVCVDVPDQQVFVRAPLDTTRATWEHALPTDDGHVHHRLVYTRYAVTTRANPAFGIAGGTTGTLHAVSIVWSDAPTGPWADGSFGIYADMFDGIRTALEADGGTGLRYLEAALGIRP